MEMVVYYVTEICIKFIFNCSPQKQAKTTDHKLASNVLCVSKGITGMLERGFLMNNNRQTIRIEPN